MEKFRPTFLIIKRHKVTHLLYFCKTIRSDPTKYSGSGKLWKKHLKKFGKEVETIWYELFTERDKIIEFATHFSIINDIVNARDSSGKKIWANLIPEKGIGSFGSGRRNKETDDAKLRRGKAISAAKKGKSNGRKGSHHREETKAKLAKQKGWKHTEESCLKMKGRTRTEEHSEKLSTSLRGKPWSSARRKASRLYVIQIAKYYEELWKIIGE